MKMKPEHYAALSAAVLDVARSAGARPAGISVGRYRWECFHVARSVAPAGLHSALYDYLNDSHIETALRRILPQC